MTNLNKRISRSLVTVIFLTLFNVVAAPVIAPTISTPRAEATTSGITTAGLVLDVNASNSADMAATSGSKPAYTASGGGYYELNGSSNYIVPNTGTSAGTSDAISIFMWVYPTGTGQLLSQLGTTTINANYHAAIMEYTSTDQLHIGLWNGSDQTSLNLSTTIATPKNNWYLVGLVYDGTKITGYINGAYAGQSSDFNYDPPATGYFGIGAIDITNIITPAKYGSMRFGSLSVYNIPISSSDVYSNFKATAPRFGPTISSPSNFSTLVNRRATFSTSTCTNATSGSATCNYQWQLSTDGGTIWNFITGANTNSYTTPLLTSAYNGHKYRLYARDPGTGVTTADDIFNISSVATLTVATPPGSDTDTALTLASGKYAWAPDSNEFDITNAITMQAWVYQTESYGTGWNMVLNKESSYELGTVGGNWTFGLRSASWAGVNTGVPTRYNVWQHVALTRAAGSATANFYIDGQLRWSGTADGAGTSTIANTTEPFTIGGRSVDGVTFSSYFAGQIDEVRVYNSARSVSEIQNDMSTYGPIDTTNLAVYYDFNEGTGSKLYNRVSGVTAGSDLNVVGSPTWSDIKILDTGTLPAYTIAKFPRSYINSSGGWKVPSNVSQVSALVVAGGGGGGSRVGGGGGGGGYVFTPKMTLTPNTFEAITVGQGGLGAQRPRVNEWQGHDGFNSLLGARVTAVGGGGGGGYNTADNADHFGRNGGSGGGASAKLSSAAATGGLGSSGQGNDGGQGYLAVMYPGGGGGGAGGPGVSSSTATNPITLGDGGLGVIDPIGGSNLCFAGGGGGGIGSTYTGTQGGSGGGCSGGAKTAGAGTKGQVVPTAATANSGSGGGGSGYIASNTNDVAGGDGGSGIIIIRWITASKPIFTQPSSDTTTAGLIDTITVSADPISPLTRNYLWQSSSDTGTTWSNISTGSGFTSQTYSTPTLETNTSGIRYQYRVIVTDSDTAGLFITDTSTAVYLTINPRISISGSYTTQKYGQTHTDTFTAVTGTGTGNKAFTFTPNNRQGITWNGATANQATLTLARTLGPGTYYETMTATDTKGATTQYALAIVVGKADTITVTSLARTDTYTGSVLSFTPSYTISGLQNSDTVTSISWSYSGTENSASAFGPSATKPINAGSYQITPTAVISNSDSYTAVTYETSTLTINRATRTITGSISPSPLKFGSTGTLSSTPSAGSDDGAVTYVSSTTDSCTVSAANLQALKSSGTCAFTARIARGDNYESATSTSVSVSLIKADTLTVSVSAITPVTYTGRPAAVSPTVTVTGLALSNSVGTNPVTMNYVGLGASGSSCAQGGACAVGDTGPGGGKVFYVAATQQSWGRYLEAAPANWSGGADNQASNISKWCEATPSIDGTTLSGFWNGFGYGYINTYDSRLNVCTGGAIYKARSYRGGGFTNWYLPNDTEFAIMAASNIRTMIGLVNDSSRWGYWGSYQAPDTGYIGSLVTASWAIGATVKGESNRNYTRPIRAFSDGEVAIETYSSPPTDAGTYSVKASALALSSGSLSDYQGITYTDGSLLINQANQRPLNIFMYGGTVGSPYLIVLQGGDGTGVVTETLTGVSSLTGCAVNSHYLTASEQKQGFCEVRVVKAGDRNYFSETQTVQLYFMAYVNNQSTGSTGSGSTIALNGATSFETSTIQAPSITGLSTTTISLGGGGNLTITGTGFTGTITVKFWRNKAISVTSSNGTTIDIPVSSIASAGATSGRIAVITTTGEAVSLNSLSITP